jgi:murein DD-endopeptidase MepM/ murein hydrolase activator NlpD
VGIRRHPDAESCGSGERPRGRSWINLENQKSPPSTISIIIAPSNGARTFQHTISTRVLWVAGVLAGLLSLAVIIGGVRYAGLARDAARARALEKETQVLRDQLSRLDEIEQEVAGLAEANARLRDLVGLDAAQPQDHPPQVASGASGTSPGAWRFTMPTYTPHHGPISRGFAPSGVGSQQHPGVDVPGPVGAPILAAGGGIVTRADYDDALGNVVVIDHHNGVESLYGHNAELMVAVGDSVTQGHLIAKLGNTGHSSAPHLHFEIREDGSPVDPGRYVKDYRSHEGS